MSRAILNHSILSVKLSSFSKILSTVKDVQCRRHSSNEVQKVAAGEYAIFENEEDNLHEKEALIESKRNKSRLNQNHRNILMNKVPYQEPMTYAHITVKYNRRMFGRYGQISGVNPGIAWPTKKDLDDLKEYESVAYPFTIQEMVQKAENRINQENNAIEENQKKISQQLLKLDHWKKDIETRNEKRIALATAAKEKKEKLIEEVRRHFGYKVDPRDERFKEMLAEKEKAEKKKAKEARTKAREAQFIAKVLDKNKDKI